MVVAGGMGTRHPFGPTSLHGAIWQDDVVIADVVDVLPVAKAPAAVAMDPIQECRINTQANVGISGAVMDDDAPGHQRKYPVGPCRTQADVKRSHCHSGERCNQQTRPQGAQPADSRTLIVGRRGAHFSLLAQWLCCEYSCACSDGPAKYSLRLVDIPRRGCYK